MSANEDETLLEEVERHPALWMLSHPSYKNQKVKDNIWYEVAFKVGKPIGHCKKRWRNIKDTYDRKKKRKTSLAATKKGRKWALEKKLAFLETTKEHRITISNVNEMEPLSPKIEVSLRETSGTIENSPAEAPIMTPVSMPSPTTSNGGKRQNNTEKIANVLEKQKIFRALLAEEKEDDVDLFFKSLAKTVKNLPKALQQRAKAQTLEIVSSLERETWHTFGDMPSNLFCENSDSEQ